MSRLTRRLPPKNYNQTTTKWCNICYSCDSYQFLSTLISHTYKITEISGSFRRPMLYPIELQAQDSASVILRTNPCQLPSGVLRTPTSKARVRGFHLALPGQYQGSNRLIPALGGQAPTAFAGLLRSGERIPTCRTDTPPAARASSSLNAAGTSTSGTSEKKSLSSGKLRYVAALVRHYWVKATIRQAYKKVRW
jgi:hypothetical protein